MTCLGMRILNILLSFDKIGCTSEEKTNEFVLFFPRFALSLQQLQQNQIQQKSLPMSYIFAIIVLVALFKALNS